MFRIGIIEYRHFSPSFLNDCRNTIVRIMNSTNKIQIHIFAIFQNSKASLS